MVQIVLEDDGRRRELDVQVNHPSATVADLAVALDPVRGGERPLLIDEWQVEPELELRDTGLHEGAVVRVGALPERAPATARREVVVVNGLDAGKRVPLEPGEVVAIGRDEGCQLALRDRSVSRRNSLLRTTPDGVTTVEDLGSSNGTTLGWHPVSAPVVVPDDVLISVGATKLKVRAIRRGDRPAAVDPLRNTTQAGTIPFNRPPRPALPPEPDEIRLPKPPKPATSKSHFSLVMIIGPLIMGAVMYFMFQRVMFLMFALLSPVMALGRLISNKRKGKKSARSEKQRYTRELRECQIQLREAAEAECRQRDVLNPDPAEVLRRAKLPSTLLWERRPSHDDFLRLRVGQGTVPWEPPIPQRSSAADPHPEELTAMLEGESQLIDAAVPIDLADGNVLGIVGDRSAALALARSLLCQATVLHGPADMPVLVLAAPDFAGDWEWAKWLPHTRSSDGDGRLLSADSEYSARLADSFISAYQNQERRPLSRREKERGPTRFVVVDDESLTEGRRAPVRNLLRGDAGLTAGIVIAKSADRLPALCTNVIELQEGEGDARLDLPQEDEHVDHFVACGVAEPVARECAFALARYEDPELEVVGAGLPKSIRLLPLLDLEECTPEAIRARWKAGGHDPPPAGPVGVTEHGTFYLDFMTDGPHGLVGGTTGAGKSELLRSMVAGMAATVDPQHLTFLLVDFKGGSAFDECAKLPHTVGMVTDLDEHLAERALRCLEAELKYRERLLREAGASDLPDYLRNNNDGGEPVPRLLVIIDEFATLKAELPDFIDALVGVAQRGRSLGVHMLLATQRPRGAISENIKANTNMRIALRMQDKGDSSDVIGTGDAADISRSAPGRAYVRLGPSEIVPIQSALSTGERNEEAMAPVEVARFVYGPVPREAPLAASAPEGGSARVGADEPETDLGVLVSTITEAFEATGYPEPRRPWPEPLPGELDLDALIDQALAAVGDSKLPDFVPVGLADDPEAQSQYPAGWIPRLGNLLIFGLVGSGTTTALSSLALSLARLYAPEELHLYVLDFGAGELAPLGDLPHCGGYVLSSDSERQRRVTRFLGEELDRRRQMSAADRAGLPMIVAMLDGWPAFVEEYKEYADRDVIDAVAKVCSDGPEVGLYVMLTSDRSSGISNKIVSTSQQRWALKLPERSDYSVVGQRSKAVPDMAPGHALLSESKLLMHIGRPSDGLAAAVRGRSDASQSPNADRAPYRIRSLPAEVPSSAVNVTAHLGERPWVLPVAIAEADLGIANLIAYQGEHALVAGPPRSGKSSTLLAIADVVRAAQPDAFVAAIATARSPLAKDGRLDRVIDVEALEDLREVLETPTPVLLLLVDDAETIDDKRMSKIGASQRENLLVVAAARTDGVKGNYNHWTRTLRRSKLGVILKPDPNAHDGELFGCRLPRYLPVDLTDGRGFVVNSGEPALAQLLMPSPVTGRGRATEAPTVS